ncbi:MAG: PhoX family phosphatase [Pseudomonadota bacterium]
MTIHADASHDLSFDEFDEAHSLRQEAAAFDRIADTSTLSGSPTRRDLLRGGVTLGLAAFLVRYGAVSASAATDSADLIDGFDFSPLPASTADSVLVPPGYSAKVFLRWGDPLTTQAADPASLNDGLGTAATQREAVGDNNDGMAFFSANGRHVLAVNNEYTNIHNHLGHAPRNDDERALTQAACGITLVEVVAGPNGWRPRRSGSLNRRITPETPIEIAGPARGHSMMRTSDDPDGTRVLGTFANCGCGQTPWGTYLTCEENFNGYFSASDPAYTPDDAQRRYGLRAKDWGYGWAQRDARFDVSRQPNEANRMGYVVEIDPFDPEAMPRKRTALGRMKHENAEVTRAADGRIVVYMGDDERGEYLYRFTSAAPWTADDPNPGRLLDDGTLAVARFEADGTGRWLDLTPGTTGMSEAEICIFTRLAASKVDATTMDRPEWVAAHPESGEVFCALTNNKHRGMRANAGGDAQPVDAVNPRAKNRYGQIVRWRPDGGDHAAASFSWDLFAMAGNPTVHDDAYAGSPNITPENMFNAPDGVTVDTRGLLWIQTDGKMTNRGDFSGMGNNQMLAANPRTGEIKRFLIAPRGAEVTGLTWSPDRRTMFVGIQHPGEKFESTWPDGSMPRSAIVAVTREDDGRIG